MIKISVLWHKRSYQKCLDIWTTCEYIYVSVKITVTKIVT